MKRKIMAGILAAAMTVSMTACGQAGDKANADTATAETSTEEAPANDAEESSEDSAGTSEEAAADSDIEYIKGKGKLIVGITDFAPMDYKDDNGEWIGYDADLAKKVAESLGVDVEFVEIDWDNKILELENKSIDVVWNGMTLTNEVTNSMECTQPYLNNAQVVVVPSDIADTIKSTDDAATLSYAVEAGSAGEQAATDNGYDFISVTSQADALMEVQAGTSGACIIDLLMAGAMIGEGTSYPDLTHTVELTTEEYGIGCRKGSDLAAYIDDQLNAMSADGSILEIAKTYGVQDAVINR